jgi:hypothetical protein
MIRRFLLFRNQKFFPLMVEERLILLIVLSLLEVANLVLLYRAKEFPKKS